MGSWVHWLKMILLWLNTTCRWMAEFLDFCLSGLLDLWSPGSAGSALHSLTLHFWLFSCPRWYIIFLWFRYDCKCCCFLGNLMIFIIPQLWIPSEIWNNHSGTTLLQNNQAQNNHPGSAFAADTASLFVIQSYYSDSRKNRLALLWNLTEENWFSQYKFGLS